jgi:hypothetical protein
MTVADNRLTLDTSDGRLSLTLHEWQGVAAALAELHPPAPPYITVAAQSGTRRAWTEEHDRELCRGWYAGDGLEVLAGLLGRTQGSVAARLVRLDLVADRAEARARP